MADLRLDDCDHCACVTWLPGWTREKALAALENGELGCDNCQDDEWERPEGHTRCCVLYDGNEVVWDGRHTPRKACP